MLIQPAGRNKKQLLLFQTQERISLIVLENKSIPCLWNYQTKGHH